MTAPARTLHPRETAFLDALETLGVLNKREVLTTRASYLRNDNTHHSLLSLLRERNYSESQLASALRHMGVPTGGPGACEDPLHSLHIGELLPYLPPETDTQSSGLNLSFERLADALISLGVPLSEEQYQTRDIETDLLARHVIDDELLTRANALWKGLLYVDLRRTPPDPLLKNRISENLITTQIAIPYAMDNGVLVVAVNNPMTVFIRNMIEDETGFQPTIVLAPLAQIQAHIHATYERDRAFAALKDESTFREETKRSKVQDDDALDDSSAVGHFLDTLIREAATYSASDIHIQPTSGDSVVRIRIDGKLQQYRCVPKNMHRNLVNRIRAMGELNNSGERRPQDAVIRYDRGSVRFNLRCSIVPTPHGGKVSLRLTSPPESIPALEHTDLSDGNLASAEWALSRSNGMIIMSGPTGSGKTVLSHSLIQRINRPEISIFTIENPIEIEMPGLNQIQINPEVPNEDMRTDYPDILRALLRQDPDVIMIGEVRDAVTARTAVQAAQTGHLMITTIHSNSAAGVITRLVDMGIESFNLSGSLRLLIAQRLAGRPCPDCRTLVPTPDGLFSALDGGPDMITDTTGRLGGSQDPHSPACPTCSGKGTSGRIGIHEMIRVTPLVEQAIRENKGEREIERLARTEGFRTLWEDGLLKVKAGHTTLRLLNAVVDTGAPQEAQLSSQNG